MSMLVTLDNCSAIIWVLLIFGDLRNVNNHGGHCADCFGDLVAIIELNVVGNLLDGAVEHSNVMCACVVKTVVIKACCFAKIIGG